MIRLFSLEALDLELGQSNHGGLPKVLDVFVGFDVTCHLQVQQLIPPGHNSGMSLFFGVRGLFLSVLKHHQITSSLHT